MPEPTQMLEPSYAPEAPTIAEELVMAGPDQSTVSVNVGVGDNTTALEVVCHDGSKVTVPVQPNTTIAIDLDAPTEPGARLPYTVTAVNRLLGANGESPEEVYGGSDQVVVEKAEQVVEAPVVNGEFTIDCSNHEGVCYPGGQEYPMTISGVEGATHFSATVEIVDFPNTPPGGFVVAGQPADSIEGGEIVDGRVGLVFKTGPDDGVTAKITVTLGNDGPNTTVITKDIRLGEQNR
ncbi:hypothetical protein IPJ72_06005 [Candidatus Peregrinibacteria bacterium]|nr:MAG: hypothetical protein IPJ72_06005 [Candidatus Peregrinibacteria bacterium]